MPKETTAAALRAPRRIQWIEIDRIDYTTALALQHDVVLARTTGQFDTDVVLALEHPPVYTLGRRGGRENLTVSEEFLRQKQIDIIQIERGGNITYHGPGQLVVYPLLRLAGLKLSVVDYVAGLEKVMVRTATHWQVTADGDKANRGAWIGKRKLGSIGITIRRGVTFHGLALNVNPDLTPFTWINPCGMTDIRMTSIEQEAGRKISMPRARQALRKMFEQVFNVQTDAMALETLKEVISNEQQREQNCMSKPDNNTEASPRPLDTGRQRHQLRHSGERRNPV